MWITYVGWKIIKWLRGAICAINLIKTKTLFFHAANQIFFALNSLHIAFILNSRIKWNVFYSFIFNYFTHS